MEYDPYTNNHDELEAFRSHEANRAVAPLTQAANNEDLNFADLTAVGDRIDAVKQRVKDSPDLRLIADQWAPINVPPKDVTEYDTERAHLVALAVNDSMSYITANPDSRRRAAAEKNVRHMTQLAEAAYDADPIHAAPDTIRAAGTSAVKAWFGIQKRQ